MDSKTFIDKFPQPLSDFAISNARGVNAIQRKVCSKRGDAERVVFVFQGIGSQGGNVENPEPSSEGQLADAGVMPSLARGVNIPPQMSDKNLTYMTPFPRWSTGEGGALHEKSSSSFLR